MTLRSAAIPAAALACILTGLALGGASHTPAGQTVWMVGLGLTGLPVVIGTLHGVLARRLAADHVATLAIIVALWLREPLPGLIVVLMAA